MPDRRDRALLVPSSPRSSSSSPPLGHISPDGLGQSYHLSAGFSRWNPNHLLVEPLGAWWMSLADPGSREEAVDHLRRLSILAGSLAAGLFRSECARRLASSRLAANHATAWLAFSSAFARLWVMDEVYMVQMPAVVAVAVFSSSVSSVRPRGAPWAGCRGDSGRGVLLSNILLAPAAALVLGLWHLLHRDKTRRSTAPGNPDRPAVSALAVFPRPGSFPERSTASSPG